MKIKNTELDIKGQSIAVACKADGSQKSLGPLGGDSPNLSMSVSECDWVYALFMSDEDEGPYYTMQLWDAVLGNQEISAELIDQMKTDGAILIALKINKGPNVPRSKGLIKISGIKFGKLDN